MRIAVLFDSFGPYHIARMLGAARYADIIAIEATPQSNEYAWEKSEIPAPLHYVAMSGNRNVARIAAELDEKLASIALDCLALPGWSSRTSFVALAWARKRGVPTIVMSESNGWDFERKPAAEWVKRRVLAHFAAGLVTSQSQARYLETLGLRPEVIFRGYNAVDNAYFASAAANAMLPKIGPTHLPEAVRGRYFLASNRFIEKKNLSRLLDAYAAFRVGRSDDINDWPLILLGDGELRSALEAQRATLGLERFVLMPGFRQISELPQFYGTAGALVHASTTEQWGLVVNEAMASGLPVAISRRCGCVEVLIDDGETGLLFDPLDVSTMTKALNSLTNTKETAKMAEKGRDRIAQWGPERFGIGLAKAATAACDHPARPGLLDRAFLSLLQHRG